MSEIITKGYLIAKNDFETFDEIITFINEHGNKFVALAKGTKKIESKNGRNLQLGNFCEFQFFLARDINKVSRLMKAHVVKSIEWPNYRQSLVTLNSLANQLVYPDIKNFKFYDSLVDMASSKNEPDAKAELIILAKYCKLTGINIHVKDCVVCHKHHIKTISFAKHGLVCGQCAQNEQETYPLEFSKLVYHLFKGEYDKMDQYKDQWFNLISKLKQYITENNGTYFAKSKKKKRVI